MTVHEWENNWAKKVKRVPNQPGGFLMVYQAMDALVTYRGKHYHVVAWCPPVGARYVEATLVQQ
jgi:hypothetical protein